MPARRLLRLLTLLLGSCYLGSVCGLDAEECHPYVAARSEMDMLAAAQPAPRPPRLVGPEFAANAPRRSGGANAEVKQYQRWLQAHPVAPANSSRVVRLH